MGTGAPTSAALAEALLETTRRTAGDGPVTLLYSGGLDSSVLAWCLRDRDPTLFTLGSPGAFDVEAARTGSKMLQLRHAEALIALPDVAKVVREWSGEVQELSEPMRSVVVAEILALERAPPGKILLGQGADELFLGYAHYRRLDTAAADLRAAEDLTILRDREWPRVERIAMRLGRTVGAPYLDRDFDALLAQVPVDAHAPSGGPTKPLLREIARALGVPQTLVDRPKKALQYGSGVARLVRLVPRAPGGETRP